MRWRLVLEEYSPELIYIKGEDNTVADALSHLTMVQDQPTNWVAQAEYYGQDALPKDTYLLSYKIIKKYQDKDTALQQKLQSEDS